MKSRLVSAALFLATFFLAGSFAWAAPKESKVTQQPVPAFPGTLVNARYVYVTSYDGDQFNINLCTLYRQAISSVQVAIKIWGKFTLVYEPHQADIVLMVTSRPSEDTLALYDAHGWPRDQYLWRMMARSGLQKGESPLVTDLEKAFSIATSK